jgi:hypothetical protein
MKTHSTTPHRLRFFLVVAIITLLSSSQPALALEAVGLTLDTTTTSATALSASVSPSSLPETKTSVALGVATDEILKKMDGVRAEDYCVALDQTLLDIASETRETLAWNVDSYEINTTLKPTGGEETKSVYAELQAGYKEVTEAIQKSVDAKKGSSARAAATLRSVYLELLAEYRNGAPNTERVASLTNALGKMSACVTSDDSALSATIASSIGTQSSKDAIVVVTREDLDDSTTTDLKSDSISSKAQLTDYIKSTLLKNETVTAVSTGPTKTDVTVRQKAKLFGFIPVHIKSRTSVATDGRVAVSYPWYKFLIRVPEKVTTEMVLEKLPKNILEAKSLSVGAQAKIVETVVVVEVAPK